MRCDLCGDDGRLTLVGGHGGPKLCAECRAEDHAPRVCPVHDEQLSVVDVGFGPASYREEICLTCNADQEAIEAEAQRRADEPRQAHLEEKS